MVVSRALAFLLSSSRSAQSSSRHSRSRRRSRRACASPRDFVSPVPPFATEPVCRCSSRAMRKGSVPGLRRFNGQTLPKTRRASR